MVFFLFLLLFLLSSLLSSSFTVLETAIITSTVFSSRSQGKSANGHNISMVRLFDHVRSDVHPVPFVFVFVYSYKAQLPAYVSSPLTG